MKIFSCQSWFSFDVSAQEICKGYPDDDAMEEIVDEEVFQEPEQEVEVAVETDEVEEKPAVADDVVVDSIEVDYEKDAVEDVAAAEFFAAKINDEWICQEVKKPACDWTVPANSWL